MERKTVAVIGTLDTKGEEFAYLRTRIESAGLASLVIDCGVVDPPAFSPDIDRRELPTPAATLSMILLPNTTGAAASRPWLRAPLSWSSGCSEGERSTG